MKLQKTLFILSYYFPPFAGVSGLRTSKFTKYLPREGWSPWVFTVDQRYYGDKITAQETLDNTEVRISRIRYVQIPGIVRLIKLFHPLLALVTIIKYRRNIDAVYMSGSPYHPFLLSVVLTRLLRIPTFLDFRDSWSINHGYDGRQAANMKTMVRETVFGLLERVSIRFATRAIFATTVLQKEYEDLFPCFANKYVTIPNGYDPDDIAHAVPQRIFQGKTIILTGKFSEYTPAAVDHLMEALLRLPDLHFVYVGSENQIIENAARRFNVLTRVKAIDYQPHNIVMQFASGADIGLVTTGLVNGLGTKIFEYLALRKPVVCLVPLNSIIATEFSHLPGVVVSHPPHTTEKISASVTEALRYGEPNVNDDIAEFDRTVTARTLARTLERAA